MLLRKISVKVDQCDVTVQMPEFHQLPFELHGMQDDTNPLQALLTMVSAAIKNGYPAFIGTHQTHDFTKTWNTAYKCLIPEDQSLAAKLVTGAESGDIQMLLSEKGILVKEPYVSWTDAESGLTVVAVLVSSMVTEEVGYANTWAAVWGNLLWVPELVSRILTSKSKVDVLAVGPRSLHQRAFDYISAHVSGMTRENTLFLYDRLPCVSNDGLFTVILINGVDETTTLTSISDNYRHVIVVSATPDKLIAKLKEGLRNDPRDITFHV